jgi:hypothetical protein
MKRRVDLSGMTFGRLTVIKPVAGSRWLCECSCGATVSPKTSSLRSGNTKSCGCYRSQFTTGRNITSGTHGMSNTPEHRIWRNIHQRCENANDNDFKNYGDRGITVSAEWTSFEQFYADMGPRPTSLHTIERLDNDGPYSKNNCVWADRKSQARNRRSTLIIEHNGIVKSATQWAEELGIKRGQFYDCKRRGKPYATLFSARTP